MAVLGAPLDPVTVASLKGTLDYYVWRGLPVVRSWPRSPKLPRTPGVTAAYLDFGATSRALSKLPIELQNAAIALAGLEDWTWKDVWTAALYGNLYADAPSALPEVDATMPPLIPGQYYSGPSSADALTTMATATGTIWAVPFYNPAYNDFDRLAIEITATTTGTFRLAIYGPMTAAPGAAPLVLDSGPITPTGTGLNTFTIGQGLAPGWYLLAYQSSLSRTVRAVSADDQQAVWGNAVGANTNQSALISLAQAYGPFPATLGTVSFLTSNRPYVLIRPM